RADAGREEGKQLRDRLAGTAIRCQPTTRAVWLGQLATVLFDRTMRRKAAVEQPGEPARPLLGNMASSPADARSPATQTADGTTSVVAIPVLSLRPADSPRLNGEDKAHIARIAE